jgi:uncharacterized protein (DUF2235 family)
MKHIVLCSDGTGNTAIKGRGTNVFKLFEAVDVVSHKDSAQHIPQIAFYDDGVGTEGFTLLKLLGGMAGWGLSRNVKELYTALARVYEPGDKLFLFGFSRGAFTVRTLAGMIARCGIVDVACPEFRTKTALDRAVNKIYGEYRKRYQTHLGKLMWGDTSTQSLPFSQTYRVSHPDFAPNGNIAIEFLGVWDTVDAVGLPFHLSDMINEVFWRFKFPDAHLHQRVKHACHALAIDDERHSFKPVLWDETAEQDTPGRIEQVWFAGVHSNVGGGYPRQGMSLVSLDWMMCKAEGHGLRFLPEVRALYRALQNVDDKLYEPRAGLGMFYRWKPRDIQQLCKARGVRPTLHMSAIERIARSTEGYAPGNIPPDCDIVETGDGDHPSATPQAIQLVLKKAHDIDGRQADLPLLDDLSTALTLGWASYYVLLGTVVYGLVITGYHVLDHWGGAEDLLTRCSSIVKAVGSDVGLWAGVVSAYGLSYLTDARFSRVCSEFWHKAQQELKKVIGAKTVRGTPAGFPPFPGRDGVTKSMR